MGLDVAYWERVILINDTPFDEDHDWADDNEEWLATLVVNDAFPAQADALVTGIYAIHGSNGFRAGSYSGYNKWRNWLCNVIHGIRPRALWEEFKVDPAKWHGKPFVELIHFSDNEGIFGPDTSAKLAKDFLAHYAKVEAGAQPDHFRLYRQFQHAFEVASADGQGCVQFR
jgi:hypothetical protein